MRAVVVGIILGLLGSAPAARAQSSGGKDAGTPKRVEAVDGKTLAEWREILKNGDASRRTTAILAICQFGEEASKAVGDLIAVMDKDPDVSPRVKAVHAMRVIEVEGKDVDRVVRALARRLARGEGGETQTVVRYEALLALLRYAADAASAVPALKKTAFDNGSWELRHKAVSCLWRIALENKEKTDGPDGDIVTTLLDVVVAKNSTYEVKLEALMGLTYMGKPADPRVQARLISDLTNYAKGPSVGFESNAARTMQVWALAALSNLGENPGIITTPQAKLANFLKNKNLDVRRQAAAALGGLGKSASPQLPALLAMLDDDEPLAVAGACQAILTIGDTGDRVTDKLLSLLEAKKPATVATALNTLVAMKKNSRKVLDAIQKQMDRKDVEKSLQAYMEAAKKELEKPAKKP
ncbi:MAG: HEAT repeat domain-containing protein [Gemmataceae bacterium]